MKMNEAFPSSFLKADDASDGDLKLTIKTVEMEDIGDDRKPIMQFRDSDKKLVLNKTNMGLLVEMYGDDTDGWIGKPVTLFKTKVDFQGKRVDALRVQATKASKAPAASAAPANPLAFTDPTNALVWVSKGIKAGGEPTDMAIAEDAILALCFAAMVPDESTDAISNATDPQAKLQAMKAALQLVIRERAAGQVNA